MMKKYIFSGAVKDTYSRILCHIWRGATYAITVENPEHVSKGVKTLYADGAPVETIPAYGEGTHEIRVIMG
jgi:hypothetical protein